MTTAESVEPDAVLARTRIAIVGSGFSGLGMAIRLKQSSIDDFVVLERADDVGGTWNDNTYPGCACDVPSHLYSFSFAPNPDWSQTYSSQQEIWQYLRDCAQRYGVMDHIRFGCEVTQAAWDDDAKRWLIDTTQGTFAAEVLVAGVGPLSAPATPRLEGLERFEGKSFHSARWDHEHDLTDREVAVIGTGASSIQFVPEIQPQVRQLYVFQRTPPWVMPHPGRTITDAERRLYRAVPAVQQLVRAGIYWGREAFALPFLHPPLSGFPERIAKRHMRRQVPDRGLRDKLTPNYMIGCKRILPSNDYYPALTKPNVELVTEAIDHIRPGSVVTEGGAERRVDTIIFGTGFHVTDMPIAYQIRGRGGSLLSDVWQKSPRAYLGTTIAGFPNLFMLIGPNTGLGHSSMVFMIESQLNYVMDCLRVMDSRALASVEVTPQAQAAFNDELQADMKQTVWTVGGCSSWYLDHQGRNTTLWPRFTWPFRRRTRQFDLHNYTTEARSDRVERARQPAGAAQAA